MAEKIIPQDFYVYVHRNATTQEVFYVGKGHGRRAWKKHGRSKHWTNIVNKHGLIVEVLHKGFQEWYAHEKEQELIALYGRKDLVLGPLINYTDGGEGVSGFVASEKSRKKMSDAQKGKGKSKEHRMAMSIARRGKPLSEKNKKGLSIGQKGKKLTEFHKNSLKKSWGNVELKNKRVKIIREVTGVSVFCVEENISFFCVEDAKNWLKNKGHNKAQGSNITAAAKGRVKSSYGYTWRYLDNMPQTA